MSTRTRTTAATSLSSFERRLTTVDMTCKEVDCTNNSCALCFDCQQSLCLNHIILHHDALLERHLSFYRNLQQLYGKLHSMSIEQCFHQVVEQISSHEHYSSNVVLHLRSIREELIEQLNRFKQKQFDQLKQLSQRLSNTQPLLDDQQASEMNSKLEQIRTAINALVYGIDLEMSNTVQCRKIFHRSNQCPDELTTEANLPLPKSSSWANGSTEYFWKTDDGVDDRSSLF